MNKPTGQAWKNWKRMRTRRRESMGLSANPPDWATEWEEVTGFTEAKEQNAVQFLQSEVSRLKKNNLSNAVIREEIFKLAATKANPPSWLTKKASPKAPGAPTLVLSDWHWTEKVDSEQIAGCNAYNITIAKTRGKLCIDNTIEVLKHHMVKPEYPGIVVCLGGDMVSGDIHQELKETNEFPTIVGVVELFQFLTGAIKKLADEFGNVFLPCVSGNHSRTTMKPVSKMRARTSYDWLLYTMLEKAFEGDERVQFAISEGPDQLFRVYNHTYLLTHGDQFCGGTYGMLGFVGPLTRGDHKKRSRNGQIGMAYDTLICGHFHSLSQNDRVIVNGSLVGYSEYAYQGNFGFEEPKQALWLTHPERGITFHMPIFVDEPRKTQEETPWVSWK